MKRLEEYQLHSGQVVRLYTSGEYRCSCTKFGKQLFYCPHIEGVKHNAVSLISAKRFAKINPRSYK